MEIYNLNNAYSKYYQHKFKIRIKYRQKVFIFIYLITLLDDDDEQINTETDSKIFLNTPIKFNQIFMLKHLHSQFYINILKSELAEDDSSKEVI